MLLKDIKLHCIGMFIVYCRIYNFAKFLCYANTLTHTHTHIHIHIQSHTYSHTHTITFTLTLSQYELTQGEREKYMWIKKLPKKTDEQIEL